MSVDAGHGRRGGRFVVLADGDVSGRADIDRAWPGWADSLAGVVAADGGARHAAELGLTIDRWIGDGDSLDREELERLRAAGTRVDLVDRDKDASDTELAIGVALEEGADELVVLGAFGGDRLDHSIANLSLLDHPGLGRRAVTLLDASARVQLVRAPGADGAPIEVPLPGRVGDLVSLLPYGADVQGVVTRGLRYPLVHETLRAGAARGLSNVREAADASISVGSGGLLVVETPATLAP